VHRLVLIGLMVLMGCGTVIKQDKYDPKPNTVTMVVQSSFKGSGTVQITTDSFGNVIAVTPGDSYSGSKIAAQAFSDAAMAGGLLGAGVLLQNLTLRLGK
jgi:hypothetical protein